MQQQTEELEGLRATLAKEKQKAKRIWREKCEQQLSHDEAIDEKDGNSETKSKSIGGDPAIAKCTRNSRAPHSRKRRDTQRPAVIPSTWESPAHRSIQCREPRRTVGRLASYF